MRATSNWDGHHNHKHESSSTISGYPEFDMFSIQLLHLKGGGSRHIVRFKNFSLIFRVFGSYICLISYLLYICLRYFFCMLFTFVAVVVVDKVWFDMFEVMFWGWLGGGGAQVNKIRKHLKTHQTREHTKHTCCQAFYFWWGNQDKAHYMVCLKLWAGDLWVADNAVSVCFMLISFHKFFAYV